MSVVLSMEEVGPCRQELEVEVPAAAVEAETQRVLEDLRKNVRVQGFRRGKAPLPLLRRRYAAEIDEELKERLIPRYWEQAQAEKQIRPMAAPQIQNIEMADAEPIRVKLVVEVEPDVEMDDNRDFELPEVDIEPSDEEVEHQLDHLREGAANWNPVERDAAQGDRVRVRIADLDEDGDDVDLASEEEDEKRLVMVEIGDERVWEELSVALTGLEAGQEADFTRTEARPIEAPEADAADEEAESTEETSQEPTADESPDEASEEAPEETNAPVEDQVVETEEVERRFRAHVVEVLEKELPELDDEFAMRATGLESLEELKERMADQIRLGKKSERHQKQQEALFEQLVERYPAPVPEGVVDSRVEELLREYAQGMMQRGADLQNFDWKEIREQVRPEAERRVKVDVLLDVIARHDEIAVSDEEVESEVVRAIASAQQDDKRSPEQIRRDFEERGGRERVETYLRRSKTVHYLLDDGADEEGTDSSSEAGIDDASEEDASAD